MRNDIRYTLDAGVAVVFLWIAISSASNLPPLNRPINLPLASRIELSAAPQDGRVKLRWEVVEPPADIADWEYQQRFAGESYGAWKGMSADGSEGSYVAGEVTNGLIYAFRVKFTNGNGDDVYSNEVVVLPSRQEEADNDSPAEDQLCAGDQLGIVEFVRGRHEVATDFMDNRASLGGIVGQLNTGTTAGTRVLVTGYASGTGEPSHNLDLSEKRARAVARYLLDNLPDVDFHLVTMAMGERHAEVVVDRKDERHQRVVVSLCRDEPEATED